MNSLFGHLSVWHREGDPQTCVWGSWSDLCLGVLVRLCLGFRYLGGHGVRGPGLQQHGGSLQLALAGGDVQGCVAVGGGRVGVRHVLEQQLHNLRLPQTGGNVERSLVLLEPQGGLIFIIITIIIIIIIIIIITIIITIIIITLSY